DEENEDDYDDTETGLDLESYFPDMLEDIEAEKDPIVFSKLLVAEDGKQYMKSSIVASLSSNRSKKVTMRKLRVQGVALEDLRQKHLNINFDPLKEDNLLKANDLVATLLRVGEDICLGIIYVKGFRKIKVIGQIMELESKEDVWLWTGSFLRLDTSTTHAEATPKQPPTETPAGPIHPVAPLLSEASTTPTWSIDNEQLTNLLNFAWEMLDPEGSKIYETFEMLPQVSNTTCLPYHNSTG
ncbi:hypothetical protein B0H14DRAFT_2164368, partial [Mycena olivaceomarginata]